MKDRMVVVVVEVEEEEEEEEVVVVVNREAEVEGDLVCRKGDPSWGWDGGNGFDGDGGWGMD